MSRPTVDAPARPSGARARVLAALGVVSPLGWSVATVVVVAAILAGSLGWAEMLAIAVIGAVVLIVAVPFVLTTATYRVSVDLAETRVVVGTPAVGRLIVQNAASRLAPATRVQLPVGGASAEFAVPRLSDGEEHDELFTIPTHRRAVLTLGPVTSVRSDPLDLLRRRVVWTKPTELYVHPRVVPLDGDTTGILRDLEGLPTRDLADDDVSFHALRQYVPGDDLRYVHWRSTARVGEIMIRQFEQTRRSHLVVILSTQRDEYAGDEEFELAVSIAGSVGLSALRSGKTVTFVSPRRSIPLRSSTQLLDLLSAVDLAGDVDTIAGLGRSAASAAPGASVAVFVTGAAASTTALRAASLRIPLSARALCLRAAVNEEASRRTLGDLALASVPQLDSLRAALRAVTA